MFPDVSLGVLQQFLVQLLFLESFNSLCTQSENLPLLLGSYQTHPMWLLASVLRSLLLIIHVEIISVLSSAVKTAHLLVC